jgi:hypothetical protein
MTPLARDLYELDRNLVLSVEVGTRVVAAMTCERAAPFLTIDQRYDWVERRLRKAALPPKPRKSSST